MKVLIFAHTPPPFHGQSYMVQLLVDGFGGDERRSPDRRYADIEIYHVNARVSDTLQDLGGIHFLKILRLLKYCAEAIWCRLRHGADVLYYVPAPAKKSAIFRDWIVMALVRPWFRKTIFHWHAAGLGRWTAGVTEYPAGPQQDFTLPPPVLFGKLEMQARALTRRLLGGADLAMVLTQYGSGDAEFLHPRKVLIVPNGIPDLCSRFLEDVLPARQQRLSGRSSGSSILQVLFLGHCIAEKGIFDLLEIVAYRRRECSQIQLTVAGDFFLPADRTRFEERIARPDLAEAVRYAGFADESQKRQLLVQADVLCFPTYFQNEALPTVILEAMACGLPVVASQWRGLPEMFPEGSVSFLAIPKDVAGFSEALALAADTDVFLLQRKNYLSQYELGAHLDKLACAFRLLV